MSSEEATDGYHLTSRKFLEVLLMIWFCTLQAILQGNQVHENIGSICMSL